MRHIISGAVATVLTLTIPALTPSPPEQITQPETDTAPSRLTISVAVADPDDLKVSVGDRLSVGDLIADRTRERQRLEAQQQQLVLALERLQTATISTPLPPATPPAVLEPTYLEEEAAIARAAATVEQAQQAIALKDRELSYLRALDNLNPLILEHEQVKRQELEQQLEAKLRDYQLALGQRSTREYQHSIVSAETVSAQNRDALDYQQQWLTYEQRLRDRDYQVSQTQLRLDEVNNAIANLAVVRSPYAGRIRQVQWLGQNPDGSLDVELTLLVRDGSGENSTGTTLPGIEPGLSSHPNGESDRPES